MIKIKTGKWSSWHIANDRTKEARSRETSIMFLYSKKEDTVAELITKLQALSPTASVYLSEASDEEILYAVENEIRPRSAESYEREKLENEKMALDAEANKKAYAVLAENIKAKKLAIEKAAEELMMQNPEFRKYVEEQRALGFA